MSKTIGTSLIIGNGWDLNTGMQTSYATFFQWLTEKEFWVKYASNSLIMYIKDKGEKENWFDFEAILLDYSVNSAESHKLIELEKQGKFDDYEYNRIREEAEIALDAIKSKLVEFLTRKQPNYSKFAPAYWIMGAVLGAFGKGPESLYTSLISRKDANKTWHFPNNRIVSFNYLNDALRLNVFLQFLEKVRGPIGMDCRLLEKMYCFVHNSLDFEDVRNLHTNIIFGTNDDERMPKALYVLRKSYWLDSKVKENFNKVLCDSKRIVIFGHSVQGIDYDYYREFFSTERSDTEIYIISRSSEDLDIIRHGLEKKGSKVKIRYLAMDCFGDEDTLDFYALCQNIAEDQIGEVTFR